MRKKLKPMKKNGKILYVSNVNLGRFLFRKKTNLMFRNYQYIITLSLAFIMADMLSAQTLTPMANTPRIGDILRKQQTEFVNTGNGGEGRVWDLSGIEVVNPGHKARILAKRDTADTAADTVMTIENRQRRYTLLRGDSLLTVGTENALSLVCYSQPEVSLRYPVSYGDSTASVFHGTASWCERTYSRVYGESRVVADAAGTLVTPDGDTLRQVMRVHTLRTTGARLLPVSTEPGMRALIDSLPAFTADSARVCLALDKQRQCAVTEDICQFYAPGCRYPVFETRRTVTPGGNVTEEALYHPADEQALLADEENERLRQGILHANGGVGQDKGGGQDTPPSPMSRCDVTVSGSMVTVTYDLTAEASVKGIVSTVSGMVMRQCEQHCAEGTDYQMRIDCAGLRRGQYVLYMNVNGQVIGYTLNIER